MQQHRHRSPPRHEPMGLLTRPSTSVLPSHRGLGRPRSLFDQTTFRCTLGALGLRGNPRHTIFVVDPHPTALRPLPLTDNSPRPSRPPIPPKERTWLGW